MKPFYWLISAEGRAWLYRVSVAIFGLLAAYGVVAESEVPQWLLAVSAALGVGSSAMALGHVHYPADSGYDPTSDLTPEDDEGDPSLRESLEDPK